ncbi:hypothetical protein HDV06_000869 [Boothiomyces sp. JEL0866]|nr:hypothetical protein HDV06_000869 [Boothiomyces sp. JEL0866]
MSKLRNENPQPFNTGTNNTPPILESRSYSSQSNYTQLETRSSVFDREFGPHTIARIKNNSEVDKRPFYQKAAYSFILIISSLLVIVFCYVVIPGSDDTLSAVQLAIAAGRAKIGSWTISTNSIVALVVTLQGILLGSTISIAVPLLTWYYLVKYGVPMKFVDMSRTTLGNVLAVKNEGKSFKPYLYVSLVFIAATVFVSCDNVALSSFITDSSVQFEDQIPVLNTLDMADKNFYQAIITDDITKSGFDFVLRAGSQPFHSAIGAVPNTPNSDRFLNITSNFLSCEKYNDCQANVTVYADYDMQCNQMFVEYEEGDNGISSSTYGIFGKGPQTDDGKQVFYRIGNEWITNINNQAERTSIRMRCITFAAKSTRCESATLGTLDKKVEKVYNISISNTFANLTVDPQALIPYDTQVPYTGEDFPIVDRNDPAQTPLPYYLIGSLSYMLQRAGDGICRYDSSTMGVCSRVGKDPNSREGNFLFDFPFELTDTAQELEDKMRSIVENYYQFIYQYRFNHSEAVSVEGIRCIGTTITNKVPLMLIVIVINAFTIAVAIASIYVISVVNIPIELGVLQLAILSYRSNLFDGLEYSCEPELKHNFVVKVVEYEGVFWFKRVEDQSPLVNDECEKIRNTAAY